MITCSSRLGSATPRVPASASCSPPRDGRQQAPPRPTCRRRSGTRFPASPAATSAASTAPYRNRATTWQTRGRASTGSMLIQQPTAAARASPSRTHCAPRQAGLVGSNEKPHVQPRAQLDGQVPAVRKPPERIGEPLRARSGSPWNSSATASVTSRRPRRPPRPGVDSARCSAPPATRTVPPGPLPRRSVEAIHTRAAATAWPRPGSALGGCRRSAPRAAARPRRARARSRHVERRSAYPRRQRGQPRLVLLLGELQRRLARRDAGGRDRRWRSRPRGALGGCASLHPGDGLGVGDRRRNSRAGPACSSSSAGAAAASATRAARTDAAARSQVVCRRRRLGKQAAAPGSSAARGAARSAANVACIQGLLRSPGSSSE